MPPEQEGYRPSKNETTASDAQAFAASLPLDDQTRAAIAEQLRRVSDISLEPEAREALVALESRLAEKNLAKNDAYEMITLVMGNISKLRTGKNSESIREILDMLNQSRQLSMKHGRETGRQLIKFANTHKSEAEMLKEMTERRFDARLEILILEYCEKINEGKNGVIFKVKGANVPEALRKKFAGTPLEFDEQNPDDSAFKLLKVFSPEKALHEFSMQRQYHDLLIGVDQKDRKNHSQIPHPKFCRLLKIHHPKTVEKLQKAGLLSKTGRYDLGNLESKPLEIAVLAMDVAPGEDLATFFFKWILKKRGFTNEAVEGMPFEQLQDHVAGQLDFQKPIPGRQAEHEISHSNAKKLFKYLKNAGLKINPELIKQLKNTLNLAHKNRLHHNDLHWRNVMASGPVETPVPGANNDPVVSSIIDFETSDSRPSEQEDDMSIVKTLEEFA